MDSVSADQSGSRAPNLLFVVPDEFRPYSIGALGREQVITPNLDRFAKQSTVFTNVVSNFPVCSPYRAILFSGKYPYRNGVVGNCNSGNPAVALPESTWCLSDQLADSDYSTGYVGKWHLQAPRPGDEVYGEGPRSDGVVWDTYTPPGKGRHGFQYWHSYGCCDMHNDPHYWEGDLPIDQPIRPGKWSCEYETDIAIDYLKNTEGQRDPAKPFALFVAYNPPHMPFDQVPDRYKSLYDQTTAEELLTWENLDDQGRRLALPHIKDYYAQISGVDDQFGRLIGALDSEGLADDTVVIFTSDHGELMGSHGLMHKGPWQNESLLVPFAVRHPGQVRSDAKDDGVISTVDLYPTIMGLMGLQEDTPTGLDGKDLSSRLQTGEGPTAGDALYCQIDHQNCTNGKRGIKTDRYTFAFHKESDRVEYFLIDNREDPHQLNNLYGTRPELEQDLKARLRELLLKAEDPFAQLLSSVPTTAPAPAQDDQEGKPWR